jgi:hypothetical protein
MFQLEHSNFAENYRRKLLILRTGFWRRNGIKGLGWGRNVYFRGGRMSTKVDLTRPRRTFYGTCPELPPKSISPRDRLRRDPRRDAKGNQSQNPLVTGCISSHPSTSSGQLFARTAKVGHSQLWLVLQVGPAPTKDRPQADGAHPCFYCTCRVNDVVCVTVPLLAFTVTVKLPVGVPVTTSKLTLPDGPPPGAGLLTTTGKVPVEAMSAPVS